MRPLSGMLFRSIFRDIDQSIEVLREIRDSYRAMNVEIYGEKLASILNDW